MSSNLTAPTIFTTAVNFLNPSFLFASAELWRIEGNKPVANHWSTPVYRDGHLYGMFQFKEYGSGPLKCVAVATGKAKWEQPGYGPGNVIAGEERLLRLAKKDGGK